MEYTIIAETPLLPGEQQTSKDTVLLKVNESQLWDIFIGLERLELIPRLQKETKKMAREIYKLGVKQYKWV